MTDRIKTYGGLKNCSSTTYIPRKISDIKKYLLALSSDDSSPWSQRLGGGRRKPGCGGPDWRAGRRTEEEKLAVAPSGLRDEERTDGRRKATSLATGLGVMAEVQ